jgi:hypothetical protein
MAGPEFKTEHGLISKFDFGKAWTEAGEDPVMRQVQDRYEKEAYFDPAMQDAGELGLSTPLGYACVYDAAVQMGPEAPLFKAVQKAFAQAHQGQDKPAGIAQETDWLRSYMKERRAELSSTPVGATTTGRVDSLQQVLDSGNLQLRLPLSFTYDGESFSIGSAQMRLLQGFGALYSQKHAHPSSLLRRRQS